MSSTNENWRQLHFLYRSYKLVQDVRISFDNTERNYRRDWQKYMEEVHQDPLELVWELGKFMKQRFIKSTFGKKEENPWSEKSWASKATVALQCNRTYVEYLGKLYGFGSPILACGLLGMIGDPSKFKGLQSLWHYCGLHVGKDGRAPKRKRGEKMSWNPLLKALLLESIGKTLIRKQSKYRQIFEKYMTEEKTKHDWKTCEQCQEVYEKSKKNTEKLHVFNRAKRKVVKDFLKDLWSYWHGNLP